MAEEIVGISRYGEAMKKLSDAVAVIAFSLGALLFFRIPQVIPNDDLNSTLSYLMMSLAFFYYCHSYQLPSLRYFRLPEFSFPSVIGLIVVTTYAYMGVASERAITLPLIPTITGVIYLLSIGLGEELVSRGFVFGILQKYNVVIAVLGSSILFGLMHLNLYTGKDWDPYRAYWHCLSAAGFGFLAAIVMIATKSILSSIVMHALYDWTVVFSKDELSKGPIKHYHFDPLWQTIKDSFVHIGLELFLGFVILCAIGISKIWRWPRLCVRVAEKLGLLESA